jgi:NADH-quinone oxidoreductase subunit M
MLTIPVLSFLIFVPIVAILVILTIKNSESSNKNIKYIAVLTAFIHLVMSLYLAIGFDNLNTHYQFIEKIPVMDALKFGYTLGLDGVSLLLLLASSFLMFFVLLFTDLPNHNVKTYVISLLVILSASSGTFLSTDILMFFLFYEVSIIPVFFIMGYFGSVNKIYATFKFFLYTVFSSIFLLIGIIYLISNSSTTYIPDILSNFLNWDVQKYLFWLFFIGFGIKVALFPFHTWLPDTYDTSPISLNIILSGILMKYGVYGFIRFVLPLFPLAIYKNSLLLYGIILITMLYSGFIAFKQPNIKRLFAYFSMSHVALIVAGIFSSKIQGIEGALFQSFSHSILNIGFFVAIMILQNRLNSSNIKDFSGLASAMPKFAILFFILGLSAMAFPLTNSFVGEFLILFGIFQDNRLFSLFFSLSILIGAIVVINVNKIMLFSKVNEYSEKMKDLNKFEFFALFSIVFVILGMGLYPDLFLDIMHTSVALLYEKIRTSMMIN